MSIRKIKRKLLPSSTDIWIFNAFSAKSQAKIPKQMRTFEDSQKSKKTVASMIERKGEEKGKKSGKLFILTFLNTFSKIFAFKIGVCYYLADNHTVFHWQKKLLDFQKTILNRRLKLF